MCRWSDSLACEKINIRFPAVLLKQIDEHAPHTEKPAEAS